MAVQVGFTLGVAKDDLEVLVFLPTLPKCRITGLYQREQVMWCRDLNLGLCMLQSSTL